ncbi:hypothetical protein [Actinoplanes sp. NPDC020271]|uniref:hypothetical protein n=1 Tax=Actinoplanes sp. NPDC020271 TaxID=3363896 RepID=UPI0037B1369B
MTGERPLDGLDDVTWSSVDGAAVVAELRELAADRGSTVALDDLLIEDADYSSTEWGQDSGYGIDAALVIRFLARIAASPVSDLTRGACFQLIETLVNAPIERHGASDAELDAKVDAVRAALEENGTTLAGLALPRGSGAHEPRWRGIARPLQQGSGSEVAAVGALIAVGTFRGVDRFISPRSGAVVADFPARPRQSRALPLDGLRVVVATPGWFSCDRERVRVWHHRDGVWSAGRVRGVVTALAVDGGDLYVRTPRGDVARCDAGTGEQLGPAVQVPGGYRNRLHPFRIEDRRCVVLLADKTAHRLDLTRGVVLEPSIENVDGFLTWYRGGLVLRSGDRLRRIDAETAEEAGAPIPAPRAGTGCAYEVDGHPFLAIGEGRQVHRFDACSGLPAGPPLNGHRRQITGVTAGVVDGRPTLFSADGSTVRRWDAATGDPWDGTPLPTGKMSGGGGDTVGCADCRD